MWLNEPVNTEPHIFLCVISRHFLKVRIPTDRSYNQLLVYSLFSIVNARFVNCNGSMVSFITASAFFFFSANTFLNTSRVRAMQYVCWMQSDHAAYYIFSAHKVSICIIEYFIAININMIIRCCYRIRMVIK